MTFCVNLLLFYEMKRKIDSSEHLTVTVLLFPLSSLMTVASAIDPMRAANRIAGKEIFQWKIVSPRGLAVELTCGISLPVNGRFSDQDRGDLLIIIGGFNPINMALPVTPIRLKRILPSFTKVVSVEGGTWLLAKTGVLDGKKATAHWEDLESFSDEFSKIDVVADRFVVEHKYVSVGGASPAFDFLLTFIEENFAAALAFDVSSVFIYSSKSDAADPQPFVSIGRLEEREPRVAKAIRLMEARIETPITIAAIAKNVKISTRRLEMLFNIHLGLTPAAYFNRLRLKSAERLLKDTNLSVQEIGLRTGYSSTASLSRSFKKFSGQSPVSFRYSMID